MFLFEYINNQVCNWKEFKCFSLTSNKYTSSQTSIKKGSRLNVAVTCHFLYEYFQLECCNNELNEINTFIWENCTALFYLPVVFYLNVDLSETMRCVPVESWGVRSDSSENCMSVDVAIAFRQSFVLNSSTQCIGIVQHDVQDTQVYAFHVSTICFFFLLSKTAKCCNLW